MNHIQDLDSRSRTSWICIGFTLSSICFLLAIFLLTSETRSSSSTQVVTLRGDATVGKISSLEQALLNWKGEESGDIEEFKKALETLKQNENDNLKAENEKISKLEKEMFEKLSEEDKMKINVLYQDEKISKLEGLINELIKKINSLEGKTGEQQISVTATHSPTRPHIEDFTSCSSYTSKSVKDSFLKSNENRLYEGVRLGISDFCSEDRSDVSVFFSWQQRGDCTQEDLASISLRFWKTDVPKEKLETKALMVGCFTDEQARTWRYYASRLGGLVAEAEYVYTIENEKGVPERVIFAPPLPGSDSPTEAVIVGDTKYPNCGPVFDRFLNHFHDLAIHVGDLTYASNTGECYGDGSSRDATGKCGWNCKGDVCTGSNRMHAGLLDAIRNWNANFDSRVRGRMPFMTTMGNHDNDLAWLFSVRPTCSSALPGVHPDDVSYNSKEALHQFTRGRKKMKELQILAFDFLRSPHFYSFNYGKIHFVSIGTEDNPANAYEQFNGQPLTDELKQRFELHYGKNSKQYKWLSQDLADANAIRDKVPWVILYTHRPMYHTASHHPQCGTGGDWYACLFLETYEPLYRQFGIDIVLSGHSHHYSRSFPMYQGKIDLERGVVHATVGTGGYDVDASFLQSPAWIAARQGNRFGFVRLRVENETHAHWIHLSPRGDSQTENDVIDETWIIRRPA